MTNNNPPGMLTDNDLKALVAQGAIDTVVIAFTDHYGRPHGKRVDARHYLEDVMSEGSHGCDYLLTVDMEMEPVPGYAYANWELGYGDFHLVPDPATLRVASWLDRSALVLCDVVDPQSHHLVEVAPRSILARQTQRLAEAGFAGMAASELEYFLYTDSYRQAAEADYANLTPAGWYIEDYHLLQGAREEFYNGPVRRHLAASGIPVETSKGEFGRGQHEMNIRFADVATMADRHAIMKMAMKEIADQLGVAVTFMAKPTSEEAGSSCHIHFSLWRGDEPAFPGEHDIGRASVSDTFRWFLGGWIAHVPELIGFFAPTVNSYKRYQDGSWAPTRLAWGYDNRTMAFRVVGHGPSLRIESRLPGADANPYLMYAAVVAAGLDGIENRIEPPPISAGDAYQARDLPSVPRSLREAAELFGASEFVRAAFGQAVQDHYRHFWMVEQEAYDAAVTDWERRRYFERI